MAGPPDLNSELWLACLDGDIDKAAQLIKDGANIEWKGQGGHSPLSIAAYSNRIEVVRLLLSSGADVDAVDEHNRSALFWSATFGSMIMTKLLLDYEADMNLLTKKSKSTVLMGAANTGRLDIVKLLVSRGASWKVANKDGLTALDVAKQEKHEHLIQYLSSLDDSELQMRKALTTDIKIKLKITRMSIHGAPGSGKTCLQHLILNEPPPSKRSSTGVVTPAVRGSTCRYMETDRSYSIKRVSEEEFITHLARRLKGKDAAPSSKQRSSTYPSSTPPPPPPRLSSLSRVIRSYFSRSSSESSDTSSPLPDSPLPTHSVHYDIISRVSTESYSEEDYQAHWTYCIDSGGQAAFQDIAPPFLRLNSLNIITLRLIDELDCQPNNEFYINGIPFPNNPNHLTNRQMITNFARSLLSVSPCNVLTSSSVSVPNLLVIGTYADRMTECSETLKQKNESLKKDLEPYKNMCITTPNGSIIHPVNTLVTDGRREESLRLSEMITRRNKSDEVEVPFRWFCFQLEITKKAKEGNFKVLTRNECLSIARTFEMESSMENALIYFDSLGILFYYPAVLPDTVITHPEPLLKALTTLVYITFTDDLSSLKLRYYDLNPDSHKRLKEDGVFDLKVVKFLDDKFTTSPSFSAQDFIKLLLHLLIVCQLPGNSQYFIPCVLPWSALPEEEEGDYSKVIDPIALTWGNGSQPVPYGLFTGLVNSLISGDSFSLISRDFKQRRNAIGLGYSNGGWLILVDRIFFIEAFFTGRPNFCHEVLCLVSAGLKEAAESCHYRQESLGDLKTGFYSRDCDHIHFIHDGFIYCRFDYKDLSPRQLYWFDNSNDIQISKNKVKVEVDWLQSVDNSPLNYYTGPDYWSVIEAIDHVSNWEELGLALQLDPPIIDIAKRSHNGMVEECRKEIIRKWMMTNDHPSWRNLCLALRTISVGHPKIAKRIGEMHPIKPAQQYNEPPDEPASSQSAIATTRTTSTTSPSLPSLSTPPPNQHQSYSKPVEEVSQGGSVLSRTSDVYQEPYQQKGAGSSTELV